MLRRIRAFGRGFRAGFSSKKKGTSPAAMLLSAKIIRAAKVGDLELVKKLVAQDRALACCMDEERYTPLHYAVYYGHKDVAALLIDCGANVNAMDHVGNTPLHSAAIRGRLNKDWKNVVELLLANQADVNARNVIGRTPLHEAEYLQDEDVAGVLRGNQTEPISVPIPAMTWRKHFALRGLTWATSFTTILWLIIVIFSGTGYLIWPGFFGLFAIGMLGWVGGYIYGVVTEPKPRPKPVEETEDGTPCVNCGKRIRNEVRHCPFCDWAQP